MWGSLGLVGATRDQTSLGVSQKIDVAAKRLRLWRPSDNSLIYPAAGFSGACDLSQPTGVNGRDQAGAFANSSWAYVYVIGGAAVSPGMIASVSDEDLGPTLPSGYTHFCPALAVRLDGSGFILGCTVVGSFVAFAARQNVLSLGTATAETAVSLASFVPPNALRVKLDSYTDDSVAPSNAVNFFVRYVTGQSYKRIAKVSANTGEVTISNTDSFDMPNVAQNLFYLRDSSSGTCRLTLDVMGFWLPNGGA